MDAAGKTIQILNKVESGQMIATPTLTPGVYMIRINSSNGENIQRLVKQ